MRKYKPLNISQIDTLHQTSVKVFTKPWMQKIMDKRSQDKKAQLRCDVNGCCLFGWGEETLISLAEKHNVSVKEVKQLRDEFLSKQDGYKK